MLRSANRLRDDYHRWHHLQVATDDLDPVYPVYRVLPGLIGADRDSLAWLCLLHVAYYHMGSAAAAWTARPDAGPPTDALLHLPCGTERRAHRLPERLRTHWLALLDALDTAGGPHAWLTDLDGDSPRDRWRQLNERAATVWGNGRWAAYKTAELAQKVCGADVDVADAGHANSTGPRHGLGLLFHVPPGNGPTVIGQLDALTEQLAEDLGEPDLGAVETSLCDFHGLTTGRYYLGHDIDAMQEQLARVPSDLTGTLTVARVTALPGAYLGELSGWDGVDRPRRRAYLDTGSIVERY